MEDIYMERIKEKKKRFTRQKMKDMLIWDKYISPKEAIELGLVDKLGDPQ
jgi:ATP-dependent protease ClpP protease subunit